VSNVWGIETLDRSIHPVTDILAGGRNSILYPDEYLKIREFTGTSAFDFTNSDRVTVDAQLRASAVSDGLGLIADYTQGTDANKMRWSRSDNKENVFLNSGDLGNATWTKSDVTVPSAGTVSGYNAFKITEAATTATHFFNNTTTLAAASGQTCKVLIRAKGDGRNFIRISRAGGAVAVTFELTGAGAKLEATATGNITLQSDGYYLCEANIPLVGATQIYFELKTALTTGAESYAGNIANGVLCYEPQFQFSAGADSTPLPTTDYPQYAGVNGRRWLVLNGAQALVSTDVTSDIFAAGDKLAYIPIQPFVLNVSQNIFRDTAGNFFTLVASSGSNYSFSNNDGGTDVVTTAAALNTSILRFRQTGGNIYLAVDSGAGYVESAPVASGNTADLSSTIQIGRTANGFYGKLGGVFTDNTGTPDTAFEQRLRSYYL
jgi:hypothetical protein